MILGTRWEEPALVVLVLARFSARMPNRIRRTLRLFPGTGGLSLDLLSLLLQAAKNGSEPGRFRRIDGGRQFHAGVVGLFPLPVGDGKSCRP
jgi:hypothetical protein